VYFDTTLIVETTGEGRVYSVDFAEAWWRGLVSVEVPFADEKRVLSFLQRRGDPFDLLAPGRQIRHLRLVPPQWRAPRQRRSYGTRTQTRPVVSHFHPEDLPAVQGLFDSQRGWPWANAISVHSTATRLRGSTLKR